MGCVNCTWSESNHTRPIAAPLTCGDFTPKQVAERNTGPSLTVIPDRCPKCNEHLTPRITKGAYKCKCDMPRAPRAVLEAAERAPLPGRVRYGGR